PGKHFQDKHLWVKKATGLGVTEFMLRLMAWLCTKDKNFGNYQMCIVTGPNIDFPFHEGKGAFYVYIGELLK
ncbi:MAG: hypothetical protein WAL79_10080, partial [Nitrososphaeraceae archaeon]